LLQIHDELIFEVEDTIVEEFVATMKKVMRGVVDLSVPIGSSADVAMSWGELK
jgi:DNA polymerase-1